MGLGSTAKKLQKVTDMAEEVYNQLNELRTQIVELRTTVEATSDTVEELDRRVTEQEALLRALAEEEGVDVDAVLADVAIEDAEDAEGAGDGATETDEPTGTDGAAADGGAT